MQNRFTEDAVLSGPQRDVLDAIVHAATTPARGLPGLRHVCLLGWPGTGKTHVLRTAMAALQTRHGVPVRVACFMASATTNFEEYRPSTLHSLFGIVPPHDRQSGKRRKAVADALSSVKVLVIDEVSMVPPAMFSEIVRILRADAPHVNLVLVGDFMQLPPIVTPAEAATRPPGAPTYAFQTAAWSSLRLRTFMLTENFRQRGDSDLLFGAVKELFYRNNAATGPRQWALNYFNRRVCAPDAVPARRRTHLVHAYPRRDMVSAKNAEHLSAIRGPSVTFRAHVTGGANEAARAAFLRALPVQPTLELKVGARVMLVANKDVEAGMVNGTCGYVHSFIGGTPPTAVGVVFDGGGGGGAALEGDEEIVEVGAHTWNRETAPRQAPITVRQIPLTLAAAMTVHKLQGMTLRTPLWLNPHAFAPGQLLVALTRCNIDDLYLERPIRAQDVIIDNAARAFMCDCDERGQKRAREE